MNEWKRRLDDLKQHKNFMHKLEEIGKKNEAKLHEASIKEREDYKKKIGDLGKPLDRNMIAQWQKDTD